IEAGRAGVAEGATEGAGSDGIGMRTEDAEDSPGTRGDDSGGACAVAPVDRGGVIGQGLGATGVGEGRDQGEAGATGGIERYRWTRGSDDGGIDDLKLESNRAEGEIRLGLGDGDGNVFGSFLGVGMSSGDGVGPG